ncbi:deoxyribonuclease V [Geothermobacter hydrogeniphilus]|uniref:Endonuclease V n=1 Tax=Geothermobacter hydrogeniphilus TaxID=1969733 RepID=A0A1X0XW79_9BACT|nr:deoxyribonuclease V [Geothermobacter hydrogeniphilus]ORJ57143.1 endonuclease V [Geothermobacter hydrogeniphilus]
MNFPDLHPWDLTYSAAIALQKDLATRVELRNRLRRPLSHVAGVDVSYRKHGDQFFAAVVVLSFPHLEPIEVADFSARVNFPYIPGLLSFRELPVLLQAFRRLRTVPDLVLVDGQGIAHPRRFGLASHLGLWLDLPTIGCAKSRLTSMAQMPEEDKGATSPLTDKGELIGTLLRSRARVKPLYISPGHRLDIPTAARLTLDCTGRYRMPEPTRLAHLETNRLRREAEAARV